MTLTLQPCSEAAPVDAFLVSTSGLNCPIVPRKRFKSDSDHEDFSPFFIRRSSICWLPCAKSSAFCMCAFLRCTSAETSRSIRTTGKQPPETASMSAVSFISRSEAFTFAVISISARQSLKGASTFCGDPPAFAASRTMTSNAVSPSRFSTSTGHLPFTKSFTHVTRCITDLCNVSLCVPVTPATARCRVVCPLASPFMRFSASSSLC
mmetsp:Transcript_79733/g.139087  ORF Transcript_79733/g.139087 Transcript_79733/m.139087 type:complete len:208 (-) Transcript_79733:132-755(-)